MNINLEHILVRTKQTTENIKLAKTVTFLYGPIGKGKSTVARMIDYCFGGNLERTPAVQQEFLSVTLSAKLGKYKCSFERGAAETQTVRVTWRCEGDFGSLNAPLSPNKLPLLDAEVYSLSDLLFYLCDVEPIKVLKRTRDPDSPLIRLSFRDIWRYCYLDQMHLDSSFFRLEDAFRGRKSQDAMRFFTGLHSDRLNQLQVELNKTIIEQQGAKEAVAQIRQFMERFGLGSELEIANQIKAINRELSDAQDKKLRLEKNRSIAIHPTDTLRDKLRGLGVIISEIKQAVYTSQITLSEQKALRAEFITTKIKSERNEQAGNVLDGVEFYSCPECNSDLSSQSQIEPYCRLCKTDTSENDQRTSVELESMRRELNDRIDQLSDSMSRRNLALSKSKRELENIKKEKSRLDKQLQGELARYDSAFVESIRTLDRSIATLQERHRSFEQYKNMIEVINQQEKKSEELQAKIDGLRGKIKDEKGRLQRGTNNTHAIAEKFKSIMLKVGFPGVSDSDEVIIDPRNWKPSITYSDQTWGFWDTGSGGKKTLFNVCYALAVHEAAREQGMPVPNILIIDSPTKNISDDENPELVQSLYREIYRFAAETSGGKTQFLLIDSDLVEPEIELEEFISRRMAGVPTAPSLIPYYDGP